jgi:malonate-semialdehyde dehydrogenase (acetylating)/methylmalonate-semialdehyde dehydrogenase
MEENSNKLAQLVVSENGKNMVEALASISKSNETVEWACTLPSVASGRVQEVSRGVRCEEFRDPIGVVASICPFNFPLMAMSWTVPIAITMGNCMIAKPSEKTPMTSFFLADLMKQAGYPDGVFQIVNGAVDVVNGLCDHPGINALTFVGSSKVAELVYRRCTTLNKRVLALGGAKNHLVAMPDCDVEMTASDIVTSFSGCCGQRCMAASVLLVVGDQQPLIDLICKKTRDLKPGQESGQIGPCIDSIALNRITTIINESESHGGKILVDGRSWTQQLANTGGTWIGPTVLLHSKKTEPALHIEIFGPVLSILRVSSWEEAIQIENANPYGNAAGVYTTSGAAAEMLSNKFRAAMIGINIGIPVPREPFSFGGLYGTMSKYGDGDITGDGAMEFFSTRRKVTTKWGRMNEDKSQFR